MIVEADITYMSRTDNIYTNKCVCTYKFVVRDFVTFFVNGLRFRVENNKMLKWMNCSGLYVKILDPKDFSNYDDSPLNNGYNYRSYEEREETLDDIIIEEDEKWSQDNKWEGDE